MRQIEAAVMCLLLIGACLQGTDGNTMHVSSSSCCYTFVEKKIPSFKIQCYRNISSTCPYRDALIFKLKGGRKSCASKKQQWVMRYLRQIKSCHKGK